jgi:hypothetical protein
MLVDVLITASNITVIAADTVPFFKHALWHCVSFCLSISVYVTQVQFMWRRYSLCDAGTVYVTQVQFMWRRYSLCDTGTLYVTQVHFMWHRYSLCDAGTVSLLQCYLAVCRCINRVVYSYQQTVLSEVTPSSLLEVYRRFMVTAVTTSREFSYVRANERYGYWILKWTVLVSVLLRIQHIAKCFK